MAEGVEVVIQVTHRPGDAPGLAVAAAYMHGDERSPVEDPRVTVRALLMALSRLCDVGGVSMVKPPTVVRGTTADIVRASRLNGHGR